MSKHEKHSPIRKYKVHFAGGEGINWALDHDIAHLCRLSKDFVEPVSLDKAEIIHSVYWGAILDIPEKYLERCLVITSIADKPQIVFSRPEYLKVRNKIDLWLCEYYESLNFVSNCGLRTMLFPDPIDLVQFAPPTQRSDSSTALKDRLGIPQDRYLIGNFHRDSNGADLNRPKKQKGADLFLEVATLLHEKGLPVHFLLAGPRRHWIRNQMRQRGIPYTFVGKEVENDDIAENTLSLDEIADLYRGVDSYVIASRWEGAPNSVLECAASKTKVISTRVGQSPDILFRDQIYNSALEGAELVEKDIKTDHLQSYVDACHERLHKYNCDEAIAGRLKYIYQQALMHGKSSQTGAGVAKRGNKNWMGLFSGIRDSKSSNEIVDRTQQIRKRLKGKRELTFALWNDFKPPPYGGGNQFMIALESALVRKGMKVIRNTGIGADAHIIQSIWFDQKRFDDELETGAAVIHRVDGPIQFYRGNDPKSDPMCWEINARIADVTVMQSSWSIEQTFNLGYHPKRMVLMWNSCDPKIFNDREKKPLDPNRKTRIISTAWSNNPRKGRDAYKWLDQHLDWDRYEYTFVGRIDDSFQNIQVLEPVGSEKLAGLLREHDIFITASQKDPCSNALVEALSCGLPSIYFNDGGHSELVGFAGLSFENVNEVPGLLGRIVSNYRSFQNVIWVDAIDDLAQKYIDSVHHLTVI